MTNQQTFRTWAIILAKVRSIRQEHAEPLAPKLLCLRSDSLYIRDRNCEELEKHFVRSVAFSGGSFHGDRRLRDRCRQAGRLPVIKSAGYYDIPRKPIPHPPYQRFWGSAWKGTRLWGGSPLTMSCTYSTAEKLNCQQKPDPKSSMQRACNVNRQNRGARSGI